jgi:hypothetical protein
MVRVQPSARIRAKDSARFRVWIKVRVTVMVRN